MKTQEECIKHN